MRPPFTVAAALLWATATLAAPKNSTLTEISLREENSTSTPIEAQPVAISTEPTASVAANPEVATPDSTAGIELPNPPPNCNRTWVKGPKMDDLEIYTMKACWWNLKRGLIHGWLWNMCKGTNRRFDARGWHWRTPAHCYNACDECITSSIMRGLPGAQCFTEAGPMAWCMVDYKPWDGKP
ncbi:hypothetical protein F4821DRAFT_261326 [Hypoxylon rubiginosum]|uniref:Uncharacterized protein n=1 Tax=Hypoxylon rubiginosum TaxID=110542 RepID=A0ACC0CXJ3_9PEZI|nr:hypothetical protein F4821DRAFT_261326 [Hypoxylon rubiginosum]